MDWSRIDPYDKWFSDEEKAEYERKMAELRQTFIPHPRGGYCNPNGMTDACYGCVCYGAGLTDECKKLVEELRQSVQSR